MHDSVDVVESIKMRRNFMRRDEDVKMYKCKEEEEKKSLHPITGWKLSEWHKFGFHAEMKRRERESAEKNGNKLALVWH